MSDRCKSDPMAKCQYAVEVKRLRKLYDVAVADRVRMHEELRHLRRLIKIAKEALHDD